MDTNHAAPSVPMPIALTDLDRRIWAEEIDPVMPDRIFDIHTHVYRNEHIGPDSPERQTAPFQLYLNAGWDDLNAADAMMLPGRNVHRVAFGFPFREVDFNALNRFTIEQSRKDEQSGAFLLVHPAMTSNDLEQQILEEGFVGLKPYRLYTRSGDPAESRITDFLPEHQLEVAHRYGLPIVLQLSKRRGVADPDNIGDLERLTDRYGGVKWILAHCARGFYPQPLERVGDRLVKLDNVYYDTAAVCEYATYEYLLELVGPGRILYGSDDLPACADRGKYITWGEAWAHADEQVLGRGHTHCDGSPTFIRYEVLRALCRAVRRGGLSGPEIDAIFHRTAASLVSGARRSIRARSGSKD